MYTKLCQIEFNRCRTKFKYIFTYVTNCFMSFIIINYYCFFTSFTEMNSVEKNKKTASLVLEMIPKEFSDMLKKLYKALVHSESILGK